MDQEGPFRTPVNKFGYKSSLGRATGSTAIKRDSLAAELERDPQLSTAKRQQRKQVLSSTLAHASVERQLVAAQTAKLELETKLREKEMQVERLERDRRWFADREQEEREEKERERAEYAEEKKRLDTELRKLKSTVSTLQDEHSSLLESHSTLQRTSTHSSSAQKSEITTLTRQISLLTTELSQLQQIADSRSRALGELQDRYDELSERQFGMERYNEERESLGVIRDELHRQAEYLREVEIKNGKLTREVSALRERETSVEVLREEKRGLERKVKMLDELREKCVKLEAEVEAGRREREEWASKAAQQQLQNLSTPSKTPVSLTKTLSDLRLSHARLLEEQGATAALLHQRELELSNSQAREDETKEQIIELEAEIRTLKDKVSRRDERTLIAEREVAFLQTLVASYNAEEASNLTASTTSENTSTLTFDNARQQRIDQLETLLQEYKDSNEKLLSELDAVGWSHDANSNEGMKREDLIKNIEEERKEKEEIHQALEESNKEIQTHLTQIDNLEQQLFELSGEIAGGRHVPPGVRVLSMRDNPEQQWFDMRQEVMDRLKGENEALMKRLKDLEGLVVKQGPRTGERVGNDDEEDGGAKDPAGDEMHEGTGKVLQGRDAGVELVPRESWELVSKEKVELEDQLKQKEKRLLRLQQVFTSKSAEFRDAIASILGLKLAFYPNGQVRVTSIYDLSASFVFQPPKSSASSMDGMQMQLIAQGEGGPQDLPSLMQYWIDNEQCIPGFMSSVTLECYENSKRSGTLGQAVGGASG